MRKELLSENNIPLTLAGVFYAVLSVFSMVTGVIYMRGKRELNPLELSDRFMEKLSDPEKRSAFARKMGAVTFVVGIVQGITSFSIFKKGSRFLYGIATGFTIFSLGSVSVKLKGKINAFPLMKFVAYSAVMITLLHRKNRKLFA